MEKVKIFAKSEVDLVHKIGVYAYTLYGYPDQISNAKPFKSGIKTMTHADCMAFVNALHILSNLPCAPEIVELEIVTDSSKVAKLILEGIGEKHCEESAKHWIETVKPKFTNLQRITMIKSDRKGTGKADNLSVLKILKDRAYIELSKIKDWAA